MLINYCWVNIQIFTQTHVWRFIENLFFSYTTWVIPFVCKNQCIFVLVVVNNVLRSKVIRMVFSSLSFYAKSHNFIFILFLLRSVSTSILHSKLWYTTTTITTCHIPPLPSPPADARILSSFMGLQTTVWNWK